MSKFFILRRLHWAYTKRKRYALKQMSAFASCLTMLLFLPVRLSGEYCSSATGAIGETP